MAHNLASKTTHLIAVARWLRELQARAAKVPNNAPADSDKQSWLFSASVRLADALLHGPLCGAPLSTRASSFPVEFSDDSVCYMYQEYCEGRL